MKESYGKGVANYPDSESCMATGEALASGNEGPRQQSGTRQKAVSLLTRVQRPRDIGALAAGIQPVFLCASPRIAAGLDATGGSAMPLSDPGAVHTPRQTADARRRIKTQMYEHKPHRFGFNLCQDCAHTTPCCSPI